MKTRTLGKSGLELSTIGMGCWAIGGAWGQVSDKESREALHAAVDGGISFFDTADVYGDGHSERLVGELVKSRSEKLYVATKAGRRLDPHLATEYTSAHLTQFVERSLTNLGLESLDLLQLHCPPTEVYYRPEVFQALDDMKRAGKIQNYGVSVEKVEEGLKSLEYPGVTSIQIIYNLFRQRPADQLLKMAQERNVGVLARVPLASGLLTGKMHKDTKFEADDHRNFNRSGQAFDVGETFAGVPFDVGLAAVGELRACVPDGFTLPQLALAWILENPGITSVIPGARTPSQVLSNLGAANLPPLSDATRKRITEVYARHIQAHVHQRW